MDHIQESFDQSVNRNRRRELQRTMLFRDGVLIDELLDRRIRLAVVTEKLFPRVEDVPDKLCLLTLQLRYLGGQVGQGKQLCFQSLKTKTPILKENRR